MAEHDGKVVFDLEIDDSKVRGDLNRALNGVKSQLNAQKVKIGVSADTAAATTQLHRVKAEADGVNGKKPTVHVTADTSAAETKFKDIVDEADSKVGGHTSTMEVDADTSAANTGFDDIVNEADSKVNGHESTMNVDADTSAANTGFDDIVNDADSRVEGHTSTMYVDADITAAETAFSTIEERANELSGKTVNVSVDSGGSTLKNGIIQGVGQGVGNSLLGAARGAIGSIFSSGSSYEYGLAKASTLMPEGADRDAFGRGLLDLAAEVGMDPAMMTEAAYNALSASQTFGDAGGDVMLDFLRTASKTAVGGYTDTNTAAAAMAKTINAYGLETSDAGRIANIMLKTQNRGITDVGKLSSSLSHVTATAANAGVSFEQVGAMLSTLTAQGVETAEATTQSRSLINELVKSNTTANKNMAAALQGSQWAGKSLSEIMAGGGNIVDILVQMDEYARKNGKTMTDMFSSVEAAQAAQMLLVNSGETYRDNLAYMEDEASVVDDAYSTMADTTEQTLARIRTQFASYATQIMGALTPGLQKFLELADSDRFKNSVGGLIDKLTGMLSGDFVDRAADGLVNLISWILDLLNDPWGTISAGITGALESAWDWLMGKAGELGGWIRDSIMAALDSIELPGWLQSTVDLFGGGGKPKEDKGGGVSGGATFTNPFGGTVSLPPSEWGGNTKTGKASAEALSDSIDDTTTAIDGATESATAMAEASAETATETQSAADSQGDVADAAADAARSGERGASHLHRVAGRLLRLNTGAGNAVTAMDETVEAIGRLVDAVNRAATRAGGVVTPQTANKYAVGLDYVPYDNYPALLHRGEMILTAAQASAYRFTGAATGGGPGLDAGALRSALVGLSVDMDGRTVGHIVERGVSERQAQRYKWTRG